ncbi:MAG: (2Fe-2S)-binding protein [Leptospiraceae bacterium]|nr:(2Fe-2S)-binding protein [Leptospiraceae bacterium]MDW8305607.1 (2Fe-2S)-binding protein [Leptospiraceae bacterium]
MRPRKVCLCRGVSRADLRRAMEEGATTLAQLQRKTLAGTGCGSCLLEVIRILHEYLEEQKKNSLFEGLS